MLTLGHPANKREPTFAAAQEHKKKLGNNHELRYTGCSVDSTIRYGYENFTSHRRPQSPCLAYICINVELRYAQIWMVTEEKKKARHTCS